jgi:monothiol glutaredoxin
MEDRSASPFTIVGDGRAVEEALTSGSPLERVGDLVRSSDVFLFIKGTPEQPMCGFSANTVAIMNATGVPYRSFDVLSDPALRDAAKEYAKWPTFPQLWVRGELVGGNDIITEMYQAGELDEVLRGTEG